MELRNVVWQHTWNTKGTGLEHLVVGKNSADGMILTTDENGQPYRLHYVVQWDDRWRTRLVRLDLRQLQGIRTMEIVGDGNGNWVSAKAVPYHDLSGCLDVDIWPTPFTNTLPIRRLEFLPGSKKEIQVAYIVCPDLRIEAKQQTYTKLGERKYQFEAPDDQFSAVLELDEDGLVLDYADLFRRIP
jgi:uncharacterized protein